MQSSELNYFKELLLTRKEQIEDNIKNVNSELKQLNALDLNDEGDHASVSNNTMVESMIVEQQQTELHEIEVALAKIANNEYGICEMCEDDIGFQRLKVKPHALYCIDCREIAEKSK